MAGVGGGLGPVAGVGGGLGPGKQQPWQPQHTTLTLTTLVHTDVERRPQSGALGEGKRLCVKLKYSIYRLNFLHCLLKKYSP